MRALLVCSGAAALIGGPLATSAASPTLMTPLQQTRRVSAEVSAIWVTGGQSDAGNESFAAVDFELFDAEAGAQASTEPSSVVAGALQTSNIQPLKIEAQGSTDVDAQSTLVAQGSSANGRGDSSFELEFEIAESTRAHLVGGLSASGATATLLLSGPGGALVDRELLGGEEAIDFRGDVEAGIYLLRARIHAECSVDEIESCRSSGSFSLQLFLNVAETATTRASLSTLKAVYD